jgi:hypothetical protein
MSRFSAVITLGAVTLAVVVAPIASADASPSPSVRDSATASGHHFWTFREADVVAGSPDNYLVITYTAGRQLSDGTIRIALPGNQWRTRLSAADGLLGEDLDDAVAVRPWFDLVPVLPEPGIDPAAACSPLAQTPLPWTVQTVLGSQVIVVRHVNCAPGQKLYVHIKGIAAPSRVGRYYLPIVASDDHGLPRLSAASVTVVPTPRVALRVTMPPTVVPGIPFIAEVDAVRPDGSPATDYSGAVAVVSEDQNDCTLVPRGQRVAYQFTPADAGTAFIMLMFSQNIAHRLRVYDIANKAVAGLSAPFQVVGPPFLPGLICPASYH